MNPSDPVAAEIFQAIVTPLLAWYSVSSREMPWRTDAPDPYRTLVSEIMLQQTRVETVKPYFERFISELPSIESLAAADEERLLKLWEGLGYYSRVRNLQKAARKVISDFNGKIPSDPELLLQLPGIGEYTAGAIASIAFGLPVPAVDGNVLRVCARLLDCHTDVTAPSFRNAVKLNLKRVYPAGRCSEFTQCIMDLGAMICLPGNPHCQSCPLNSLCAGFKAGSAASLPVKKAQPPRRIEFKTVFLLRSEKGRIALRKRPDSGILAGLWEYPAADGTLTRPRVSAWAEKHGISVLELKKAGSYNHIFTHLEWHMSSWKLLCKTESSEFIWVTREELDEDYSLPGAFKFFNTEI